jgi:hypothetical protein
VRATAASAAIRKRAANARDKADRDNDQASREGAKACGTKETSSCTNGNFEPFEHDRFEARKPGQPIESHFMLTRLIAQLFSIRREGKARRSRPPRSGRYPSAVGCVGVWEKVATAYRIRVSEIRSFQSNAGSRWSCEHRGSQTTLR